MTRDDTNPRGYDPAVIMNVIRVLLPGLELAVLRLVAAPWFAVTTIGLPLATPAP